MLMQIYYKKSAPLQDPWNVVSNKANKLEI